MDKETDFRLWLGYLWSMLTTFNSKGVDHETQSWVREWAKSFEPFQSGTKFIYIKKRMSWEACLFD